jgi:hypothetical protein
MENTTVVQKFQDGLEVPQPGFDPLVDSSGPTGPAGGDLGGTFPNPSVLQALVGQLQFFSIPSSDNPHSALEFYNTPAGGGDKFSFVIGAFEPENGSTVTHSEAALYLNIDGTPGTALAPGTLIYQTGDAGSTWTAIL